MVTGIFSHRLALKAIAAATFLLNSQVHAAAFASQKWPAYHENELEALWLEGRANLGFKYVFGNFSLPFAEAFIKDCSLFPSREAAQWVRLAYHDSATHNVNGDGLGGLDQSIRFELDRSENVGRSLIEALLELGDLSTMHVSAADAIALGVVHAVAVCRGPLIPFRGGRIDAIEAGPLGVPQPHDTLEEHTASFAKQGFSKTEMIELVACGHTMGSVHHADFPELGPYDDDPADRGRSPMDSTPFFDTAVVDEYLSGTTKNVLVTHSNKTLTSDLRIFGSDGNKTMRALSNPSVFQRRCARVFEKMINTVPRNVQLSPVLAPIKVKVGRSFLTFNATLGLYTDIRFLSENPNRNVTLKWRSRSGDAVHSAWPSYVTVGQTAVAKHLGHEKMVRYWFEPSIDPSTSISKFWFEVDEAASLGQRKIKTYDNNGQGYPIEHDAVVFAPELSSHIIEKSLVVGWRLVVAIRNTLGPINSVNAKFRFFNAIGDRPAQLEEDRTFTLDDTLPPVDGFDFYSTVVRFGQDQSLFSQEHATRAFFNVSAVVGGTTIQENNLSTFYMKPANTRGIIIIDDGTRR